MEKISLKKSVAREKSAQRKSIKSFGVEQMSFLCESSVSCCRCWIHFCLHLQCNQIMFIRSFINVQVPFVLCMDVNSWPTVLHTLQSCFIAFDRNSNTRHPNRKSVISPHDANNFERIQHNIQKIGTSVYIRLCVCEIR